MSESEDGELSDFIAVEDFSGSESLCGDNSDWEVVEQATIAIDYANVPVFLKTLRTSQTEET